MHCRFSQNGGADERNAGEDSPEGTMSDSMQEDERRLRAAPDPLNRKELKELSRRVRHRWGLRMPMRDGTLLAADLHLPPAEAGDGRYPVVIQRPTYNQQRDYWL